MLIRWIPSVLKAVIEQTGRLPHMASVDFNQGNMNETNICSKCAVSFSTFIFITDLCLGLGTELTKLLQLPIHVKTIGSKF